MKRRLLLAGQALVLSFTLAACGATTGTSSSQDATTESTAAESTDDSASTESAADSATETTETASEADASVAAATEDGIPFITSIATETVTVDPANPLGTELAGGLYAVELESGRLLYHYVPESIAYRQPAVAIGVPADSDAQQFIEDTGWKALADERGFSLILMVADENGYADDELAYAQEAAGYMDDRTYLQMQDSAFYMVGYGDAANMVMDYAVMDPEMFAGFAAFGVDAYNTDTLDTAIGTESSAAGMMLSEVDVPMWIGADTETASVTALIDYWRNANECTSTAYSNDYADQIYVYPDYKVNTNELVTTHCSKVMVTLGLEDVETSAFTNTLYQDFLMRTRRQDSTDIGALRPFETNDERGMDHVTMDVNGTTREFYVYVPSGVKNGTHEQVPVVFAFHGAGGSGEEFANRCGWDKVGEERNLIVVFPTGHRSNDGFKASTIWGDDDLDFFEQMRSYVLENYSADKSRIYVSGQSMGCWFSTTIALTHPEWIAACAAASLIRMPSEVENVNTDLVMPYMVSIGEKDKYFQPGAQFDGKIPVFIGEWRARYGITADESNTYTYNDDEYYGYDFKNADGITLIREQHVREKVHAILPEEVYTLYEFLSDYSRGEDGTSYYMGVEISAECE